MNKKKLFFFVAIALVILILIVLALWKAFQSNAPREKATLQFWGVYDASAAFDEAIRAYKKLYPNITVEYRQLSYDGYEQELIEALAVDQGPDIWLMHNTWLPKHYNKIEPLPQEELEGEDEPIFTLNQFKNTFVEVAEQDLVANGQIYALPTYVDTMALYYNKDLFNSAGITGPPLTWDDFVADVGKLTIRDGQNNITRSAAALGTARNINRSTDLMMLLMMQSGVRMTDDGGTHATFSQSVDGQNVGETALQFYTEFADTAQQDRYTWNDSQKYSIDAFVDGNTAMMFNYSHHMQTIRERSPRLNFAVAPMPQHAGVALKVNFANYWAPTVSKKSLHVVEAWRFLAFLTISRDGATAYFEASGRPPAQRALIESLRNIPDVNVYAAQALTARSWTQTDNVAIETIFADMIDDVNFNRRSVPEALRAAEEKVSVLMRR